MYEDNKSSEGGAVLSEVGTLKITDADELNQNSTFELSEKCRDLEQMWTAGKFETFIDFKVKADSL